MNTTRSEARIYVASAIGEATTAQQIANSLTAAGHVTTSSWHADVCAGKDPYILYGKKEALRINLCDMRRANMLVVWTAAGIPKATYGEIAFMLYVVNAPVVWIQGPNGEGGSIFDADPRVTVVRVSGNQAADRAEVLRAVRDAARGMAVAA